MDKSAILVARNSEMEEKFNLPVKYKGEERDFEVKLIASGYIHKFHVDADGVGVFFEPDEERQYRAVLDQEALEKNIKPNEDLIRRIGEQIEELFSKKK